MNLSKNKLPKNRGETATRYLKPDCVTVNGIISQVSRD